MKERRNEEKEGSKEGKEEKKRIEKKRKNGFKEVSARYLRFMPLNLTSQDTQIRRLIHQQQSRQLVHMTLFQNYLIKNRASGIAKKVQCQCSKTEALRSNAIISQNKQIYTEVPLK